MEKKFKIAVVQMKSEMKDTKYNLKKAIDFIEKAKNKGADIVCLPELFYSGYHLHREEFLAAAEKADGHMYQELSKVAKDKNLYIIGGYPEKTEVPGIVYNSSLMIDNNGSLVGNMRKVYLWGKEKLSFREGNKFPVFDTPFGRIGMLICYDIEFPEPPRIMALKGAEIILAPSVWSKEGENRWDIDLPAAALYNVLFTVGINTIDNGACGKSKIVNPRGDVITEASIDKEEIIYANIDLNHILKHRAKIPYMNDFKPETFNIDAIKTF
ncbi:MAG: carbon-nitrogen hydrolase family protein [Clostridiaceae bacterium]|nr:carbon-nitrogen hydrolase family protein [Clostridiaceae bacterium]